MRKYTLLFIVLTLVLAACRIESNIGLDINEDGSATLTTEIGFDDEFLQLMASQGDFNQDDLLRDMLEGSDGDVTERRDGDMNYFAVTTEIADLSTWDGDEEAAGFSSFSYTFDTVGAQMSATLIPDGSDDLGGDLGFDPSALTDDFVSANLIVNMPGTVTAHNADEFRNGALVWKISLTDTTEISAASTFGGSGTSWVLILLIVMVLAALVAAAVALIVSRKNAEKQLAAIQAAQAAQMETASEDVGTVADDLSIAAEKPATADDHEADDDSDSSEEV